MTDYLSVADLEHRYGVPMDRDPQEDRDRAMLARIGGNEYRRLIVLGRARGERLDEYAREDALAFLAGESYLIYHYHDVWRWTDTEGHAHITPARVSGPDIHSGKRPSMVATLPESAFDWPVYRAAMSAVLAAH